MRVALISVENNILRKDKDYYPLFSQLQEYKRRQQLWNCPNLGLLTVAAYFPEDWSIQYIDLNYETLVFDPYDMVFLSATTAQANRAYEVAGMYRNHGVKVAIGGIHASVCTQEAMLYADIVFSGESENVINQFILDIEHKTLKKLYHSDTKPDLSKTKVPRYELAAKYPYSVIPIQISRGCPHRCEFCASTSLYGSKRRQKSLEIVEEEIIKIKEVWKNPFIFFTDDNMFLDKKFIWEFIDLLRKHQIQWYSFTDVGIASDNELLSGIAGAGCRQLLIGFESLSSESLKEINKSEWKSKQSKNYLHAVEQIQSTGIGVVGSFVLGLDGDTKETFIQIAEFVENSHLYATNLTVLTPFPGTAIYNKYIMENRIFENNWFCYNGFELTYYPKNLSIEEFNNCYQELNIRINSSKRMEDMMTYFKNIYKLKINRVNSSDLN